MTAFATAFDRAQQRNQAADAVRRVPGSAPLTDEDTTRGEIRNYLEAAGVDEAQIAAALDVRPNVIRALCEAPEIIPADARQTLLRGARRWCRSHAAERKLRRSQLIHTAATRLVVALARTAQATRTVGLVTGGPGLGKSAALKHVAAELPGRVVITRCDPDCRLTRGLMRRIGAAACEGRRDWLIGTTKRGVELLRATDVGLLVLDEAHLLSLHALEAARAIFDECAIGLLLVGTAALGGSLSDEGDPLCGPLVSRVALRSDLDAELFDDNRAAWIDAATVHAIIMRHVAAEFDQDARQYLWQLAAGHPGHLRTAVNAAKIAGYLAGPRPDGGPARVGVRELEAARRIAGGQR